VKESKGLVFETMHRRKDGSIFPVEVSSRLIELNGKSLYQSIIRDITDRKRTEIALINEKNRSEAIIAAIGDGIGILDRDFKILYQNQIYINMAGNHIGEFCYMAFQRFGNTCEACAIAEAFRDGLIHTTSRSMTMNGRKIEFEITASPLRDETGTIIAGIEVIRDLTGRKQAENSLRERNAYIEAILDNLPIGLSVNSIADGKAIYMNAAFEEIYGWPKNILTDVEAFFTHVYPDPDYRGDIKEKVLSDIAGGDPSKMRWDNVRITTQTGTSKFITAINIRWSIRV